MTAQIGTITPESSAANNSANGSTTVVIADMSATLGAIAAVVSPGQVLTGLTLVCANGGPDQALNATCVPSADVGAISNIVCTPTQPQASLANGASISCTYDYTAPGTLGGSNTGPTTVNFTGTTGASNDSNPANNGDTDTAVIIDAVNDTGASVNGFTGGIALANVLATDQLGGAGATLANVNLTQVSSTNAGVSLNIVTGAVTVAPGTPAGSYTLVYQICSTVLPLVCDTAQVSVTVTAPIIDAVNDTYGPINGVLGGSTASVLGNDTLNGVAVNPADISLAPGVSPNAGLTMNPDGTITIAPGTPAGVYAYPYTICQVTNPLNCDTATATVTVLSIDAVNDGPTNVPATGGTTPSVVANDTINGGTPAVIGTNVTLTPGPSPNAGLTMNPSGTITVAPGTAPGTYGYSYTICQVAPNQLVCDMAVATVVVQPTIDAVDDGPTNIPATGGTTPSVIVNDTSTAARRR
ncbi:MAG: hypothetical protein IPO66_01440 [Rhodanobacteraceae bacterium]|nr:hypothetical protein [Rhodanobacteraceae bacterium]